MLRLQRYPLKVLLTYVHVSSIGDTTVMPSVQNLACMFSLYRRIKRSNSITIYTEAVNYQPNIRLMYDLFFFHLLGAQQIDAWITLYSSIMKSDSYAVSFKAYVNFHEKQLSSKCQTLWGFANWNGFVFIS